LITFRSTIIIRDSWGSSENWLKAKNKFSLPKSVKRFVDLIHIVVENQQFYFYHIPFTRQKLHYKRKTFCRAITFKSAIIYEKGKYGTPK
jgi:hypothetical protein